MGWESKLGVIASPELRSQAPAYGWPRVGGPSTRSGSIGLPSAAVTVREAGPSRLGWASRAGLGCWWEAAAEDEDPVSDMRLTEK
ncbi:Hypothetical predicted protein [Marmota monax]|uniref:Uncharacterized protein n=1 Tax=Marmota monax TaxID=9995 RepID=A0A5E4CQ71_MARMO|nr:Hypothetical predicted protein [Marmota monax]